MANDELNIFVFINCFLNTKWPWCLICDAHVALLAQASAVVSGGIPLDQFHGSSADDRRFREGVAPRVLIL